MIIFEPRAPVSGSFFPRRVLFGILNYYPYLCGINNKTYVKEL
jgi:hypothetical protein